MLSICPGHGATRCRIWLRLSKTIFLLADYHHHFYRTGTHPVIYLFLIVLTASKPAQLTLGLRMVIPMRTGVVRDIRTNCTKNRLSAHRIFYGRKKGDIMSRMSSDVVMNNPF